MSAGKARGKDKKGGAGSTAEETARSGSGGGNESEASGASGTVKAGREGRARRAVNGLWVNHTSLVSGAEESMRAVLAQWRAGKRGEFRDIDAVAALPGEGPFAQALREGGNGVVFAPLRRLNRPQGLFEGVSVVAHVWQVAPLVARLVKQTNSHLVHSNSSTAHIVAGVAAARLDIPALWHARDLVQLGRAASFLSSRSAYVIAISGCVAESLQKQGVAAEKIRIIRNGIDPELWKASPGAPRRVRHSLKWDKQFVFGCIGQMVPWKNARDFIYAAALLCEDDGCANARFLLAGGDLWNEHADYISELRALVKAKNLDSRICFVEFQTDNRDLVASLDCLVHAALEEPLGRVLLEAMAMGVPAVAYARNGPLEIILHEHDGLLAAPCTPEELARQMRRVLVDSELREHLIENGPQTIHEKFHIADVARATAELYREAVG
jgi:glycosyltransferase involved in cell wall biosynthesis